MAKIQDKDPDVEDKPYLDTKLGLIVQKQRGKIQDRYTVQLKNGIVIGWTFFAANYKDSDPMETSDTEGKKSTEHKNSPEKASTSNST